MTSLLRAALAGCAALALVPALAHAAPATPAPRWTQAVSDIPPDAQVRFGILPNGMRYAIAHNATPPNQTSIRLRIASGSFEEAADQQGLAHFLEHMAFKGSTHVPAGEMVKLLQRHGLAFGPDTNAFTSFDQTVYQLDLPESDEDSIDLGLMLMRETGSELTLDDAQFEPERGVVLSEERLRDTPGYEAQYKRMGFVMKNQLAPTRWPIGKVDVLKTAPISRLRAFYEANYRPERATLVVVGDIDVDKVEAKIKAKFGDWQGKGPSTAEPVLGTVAPRTLDGQVIVQPGVPMSVSMEWTRPHDPTIDSRAKEARDYLDSLGVAILNRRMERLSTADDPPFLAAGANSADDLKSIREAVIGVTVKGDDWRRGLTAAEKVRRQALQFGVTPEELARAIADTRTGLKAQVEGASTRRSPQLADTIAGTVESDEVYNTPASNLDIFDAAAKTATPAAVDAALKAMFAGNGPLIVMTTPKPIERGELALIETFKAANTAALAAPDANTAKTWPYDHFGPPGKVTSRKTVDDLGVTYVHFANGVRLTFKHTDFTKDEVDITFDLPGGILTLPKDRLSAGWASVALPEGGTKALSATDAEQALTGKIHNLGAQPREKAFVLSGRTRPSDLDTEMQFLTAYLTEPGWRATAFDRTKTSMNLILDQLDSSPSGVLARTLETYLHDGDKRFSTPTKADVAATQLSDLRALWDRPLAGPVDITMVGDLALDQAIDAVARTVGSLSSRGPAAADSPGGKVVHFPAGNATPIVLTHKGRADQAVAYIAWPANDYFADMQEARAVSLATEIFSDRLLQRLRIAEGATYSPSASARLSDTFPGYGLISASVETPPGKIPGFYKAVAEITADLRNTPVTADELERAKKPRVEQIEKAKVTNEYWMGWLDGGEDDPRRLTVIRDTVAGYQAVTIADIQKVARKYFNDAKAFRLNVVADPSAAPAPK